MRTANELPLISGHIHPNPLASHAPTPADMDSGRRAAPSAPPEPQTSQGATFSRPSTASAHAASNRNPPETNGHGPNTASVRGPSSRPLLLRAKSDIGPRPPEPPPESADEANSVDGHFKIRHGWDDQLNSEEYNQLLTSVSCLTSTSDRRRI